jgi:hypothetical protein
LKEPAPRLEITELRLQPETPPPEKADAIQLVA